ncbi:MAG TPA: carboxypeptidase-like regulatory domain-containing protein [Planctomycetota bacterium]|nr:carboxypeptidase-like regulatory domain-containing protein [Planctomycetota bacterium]
MRRFSQVLVVVVLAGQAVAAAGEGDTVEFKGTVRTVDGKPLSGITVVITYSQRHLFGVLGPSPREEVKATSDARGHVVLVVSRSFSSVGYRVETPADSPMRLVRVLSPVSHLTSGRDVGDAVAFQVEMKAGAETLSGKVTDEADKPVKDATVTISLQGTGIRFGGQEVQYLAAPTDAKGVYRFTRLLSGSYGIHSVVPPRGTGLVPMPESWRAHGGVQVPSKQAEGLDFTLKPGCGIRGRVLDEAGKPVEGAEVSASRAAAAIDGPAVYERTGNFSDGITTDADGRYTLEGLSPETYQVSAAGPENSDLAPSHPVPGLRVEVGKTLACQDIVLVKGGTLEGKVTGADGKPVPGVRVQYGHRMTETDEAGHCRFEGLPTGTSDVWLIPPVGSIWAAQTIEGFVCMAKVRVAADWRLEEGGTVSGRVTGEDGKVVSAAAVWASFSGYRYVTATDDKGQYRLTGLVENSGLDYKQRPQLYSLGVHAGSDSDYMSGSVQFNITLGEKITRDVTLPLGGTLSGMVTTVDGKPVEGASIEVFKEVGRGGRSYFGGTGPGPGRGVRTGADGRFVVKQLPSGWVNVSATPPDDANLLAVERPNIGLEAGKTTAVKLSLKVGGELAGTLKDPAGKPIRGAQVTLAPKTSSGRRSWGRPVQPVTTDDRGRYGFVGLDSGPYQVQVRILDGRHVAAGLDVDVKEGDRTSADIRACKGAFIEVTVTDAAGRPVPDVSIRASAATKGVGSVYGRADKAGLAVIGPLLPDTYAVNVNPYQTKDRAFKPTVLEDVEVREGQHVKRRVELEEGPKPTPRTPRRGGALGAPAGVAR